MSEEGVEKDNYYLRALKALEHHGDEDDEEPPSWYEGDMG